MYYKKGKSSLLCRQASFTPFKDPIYHQNWLLSYIPVSSRPYYWYYVKPMRSFWHPRCCRWGWLFVADVFRWCRVWVCRVAPPLRSIGSVSRNRSRRLLRRTQHLNFAASQASKMEAVDNFNGPEQTHLFPVKWSSGMESNLTLKGWSKNWSHQLKTTP